jgi:hypothetical protein
MPKRRDAGLPAGRISSSLRRIVTWNGKHVPPELCERPAGRYMLSRSTKKPRLSLEEDAGVEAALESYRQSGVMDGKRARCPRTYRATCKAFSSFCPRTSSVPSASARGAQLSPGSRITALASGVNPVAFGSTR